MKKFVLLALVLVLTTALAFAFFQAPAGGSGVAGRACPNVGWNSSPACMVDVPSLQGIARGGNYTPDVGWNS